LGGDEFAVLLKGRRAAAAETAAAALIATVGLPYDLGQGTLVRIGLSVGIADFGPDAADSRTLLVRADRALYTAKERGKGTYHRYRSARDGGEDHPIGQCHGSISQLHARMSR
jgi:diguanylate cyclase (GGDEF)-like protein